MDDNNVVSSYHTNSNDTGLDLNAQAQSFSVLPGTGDDYSSLNTEKLPGGSQNDQSSNLKVHPDQSDSTNVDWPPSTAGENENDHGEACGDFAAAGGDGSVSGGEYPSHLDQHHEGSAQNNNDEQQQDGREEEDENFRKLFVGGLSWDTNEEDLSAYFAQFGNLQSIEIKYDRASGQSRGFGFVTFEKQEHQKKVLEEAEHRVKGKKIDPKPAVPQKEPQKKIFVGCKELIDITEEELKSYFKQYGTVENIEVPFDFVKGQRKQFVFISFSTEVAAKKAVENEKQTICGKSCDVRFAISKDQSSKNRNSSYGHYGGSQSHNNYGYYQSYDYSQSMGSSGPGYYGQYPPNYHVPMYPNNYSGYGGYPAPSHYAPYPPVGRGGAQASGGGKMRGHGRSAPGFQPYSASSRNYY